MEGRRTSGRRDGVPPELARQPAMRRDFKCRVCKNKGPKPAGRNSPKERWVSASKALAHFGFPTASRRPSNRQGGQLGAVTGHIANHNTSSVTAPPSCLSRESPYVRLGHAHRRLIV